MANKQVIYDNSHDKDQAWRKIEPKYASWLDWKNRKIASSQSEIVIYPPHAGWFITEKPLRKGQILKNGTIIGYMGYRHFGGHFKPSETIIYHGEACTIGRINLVHNSMCRGHPIFIQKNDPLLNIVYETPTQEIDNKGLIPFNSPIVGQFFIAWKPGDPALIKIGDKVEIGTILGVITVMKVHSPLECEIQGKIAKIDVINEEFVEEGQTLMWINPQTKEDPD